MVEPAASYSLVLVESGLTLKILPRHFECNPVYRQPRRTCLNYFLHHVRERRDALEC
jgi:hypothetical protein